MLPTRSLPAARGPRLGARRQRRRADGRPPGPAPGTLEASASGGMMPALRSRTVTHGRNMAGARALLRATGVAGEDIGKPIIAVANSFTEFVPGHVHLREVGQVVADAVTAAGGVPREFNTIAVDDGIAMGHGGMLYSLRSEER